MNPSQVSSLALAIFLLILPTFSSSSCLTKLPCDSTIEIKPPFFVGTPGLDPAIEVQDVRLSVLKNLSCSLKFSFTPNVPDFLSSYSDLEEWYKSISCGDGNLTLFQSMFGHDKAVHQITEPEDGPSLVASCHASPRFQWVLNFSVGAGQVNFSVLSASITKYLSDCISPSP